MVRRQARGQATRIRLRALRDAAVLTQAVDELARDPERAGERLTGSLRDAIERIAAAGTATTTATSSPRPTAASSGRRPESCSMA